MLRRQFVNPRVARLLLLGAASGAGFCRVSAAQRFNGTASNTAEPLKGGDVQAADTHPDFQPKMKVENFDPDEIAAIKSDIRDTIAADDVVIFMKGVPEAPVCGFSKRLVDICDALGLEYTSFDCLAHPIVRSYVKELSDWPTIPQMWVKGEFVGGVDIIYKMGQAGQLQKLLADKGVKHRDFTFPDAQPPAGPPK